MIQLGGSFFGSLGMSSIGPLSLVTTMDSLLTLGMKPVEKELIKKGAPELSKDF